MAYEQLPIVDVDLNGLLLDLDNYRIPTHRDDEAAALKYLFASEDVLGAAKLILRDGYFDNEVPIVISSQGRSDKPPYIVLEGNRRVSALKALQDPSVVPGHETELRALLKRYAVEAENLPERIRVLVAPDRATAAPHVARLHTGISKRRWSRDQQATFYYSLIDAQTTVDDVKAQYPDVDVVRFVKMAVVRKFLASAPFKDHSLRLYASSDDLRMSVFEYAYRNKEIAAIIGAEFGKDGQLLPATSTPEKIATNLPTLTLAVLEYVVNEFRADRLNTRSPELRKASEAHKPFVELLKRLASGENPAIPAGAPTTSSSAPPPDHGPGSPTTGTPSSSGPKPGGGPGTTTPAPPQPGYPTPRGPNHPSTKDTLDLSGVQYDNAQINLKHRYFELRKISLSELSIASAILLRSVLESTIKVHFESSSTPVSGELATVFKQIVTTYGQEKALKATINTIQSGGVNKQGSIQWFNLVAHSADASVTAEDVRQAWRVVNPLLRRLLLPPAQKAPTSTT